ncbi:choline binding protein PcpA [Streptococcus pneumoniae]|nr:choline binding protein PcpA [Streptococcus pneumoniae]
MKKTTILSLTTAAVILAAYVPNEPILADTPSSEVIKETKVRTLYLILFNKIISNIRF